MLLYAFIILLMSIVIANRIVQILKRNPFLWLTNGGQSWAVVTGAGSGMGFEFARQLALKDYNLMMISLYEEELDDAKQKILQELLSNNKQTTIQIRTLVADFSQFDIYERVEQFLAPFKKDIFVLVNNVGVINPIPDFFLGNDHSNLNQKMINVNIVSLTRMTELVLPAMVANHQGLVICMSSITSRNVVPMMATYSATKAYVAQLSKCLAAEYGLKGIIFATFLPLIVSTQMSHNLTPNLFVPSSRDYVKSALNAIKYRNSFQSNGYFTHSLVDHLFYLSTLILSTEILSKILISILTKAHRGMLNVMRMKVKPKLDLAIFLDLNNEIWK